jgi:hypothetical protein
LFVGEEQPLNLLKAGEKKVSKQNQWYIPKLQEGKMGKYNTLIDITTKKKSNSESSDS